MGEGTPVATAIPTATQIIEVTAPSTLDAGYTFLAEVNGTTVNVTVPEGGVKEGQRFTVPVSLPARVWEATPLTGGAYSTSMQDNSPRGAWKDGLCDCLSLGLCHPSLWCAWCCPQILMAQVLTRMKMSWLGERDSPRSFETFPRIFAIVVAYYVLSTIFAPPKPVAQVTGSGDDMDVEWVQPYVNPLSYLIYQMVNLAFGLYTLVMMVKLRAAVRDRYSLPDVTPCGSTMEDICCACCCGCCTVAQLARHTADYENREATCCSSTGLQPEMTGIQMVV